MKSTQELVKEIRDNLSQKSSSQKDEVAVMQAMINDKEYKVDVYGATGKIGEYCPSEDARKMTSSLIASTTKISKDEADHLADEHEFSKNEAAAMVNISKEFVNTYLETGRKLPLGGREKSNVSLIEKDVKAGVSRYPSKTVDANGIVKFGNAEKNVPAHKSVKVNGPCPSWVH